MTAPLKWKPLRKPSGKAKAEPSKAALRLARDMAKAFDALTSDWTAVVVVLRRHP